MIDDSEFWGWLAGFWEGEGYLLYRQGSDGRPNTRFFMFGIAQTDPRPLEYVQYRLGIGKVSVVDRAGENKKALYHFRITGAVKGLPILEVLRPHLRFRTDQVDRVMAEIRAHHWSAKPWTKEELQILKDVPDDMTNGELTARLARSSQAVQRMRRKLVRGI